MRRLIGILLVLILVIGFATPAFADESSGSITITKYKTDRVPTEGPRPDGTQQPRPDGAIPSPAVRFKVERVVPIIPQPTIPPIGTINGPFFNADHGTWYELAATPNNYSRTIATNTNGVAFFDNLARGIYYVTELENFDVADPIDPFFVAIPTIINQVTGSDTELMHVFAYPKNENLGIFKEITGPAPSAVNGKGVSIGDIVDYRITITVPTWISKAKAYNVIDTYSKGLAFEGVSEIRWFAGSTDTSGTVLAPSLYDVTNVPSGVSGGKVTIDLIKAKENPLPAAHRVEIMVKMKVMPDASLTTGMPNEANLYYTNQYGHEKIRMCKDPTVFTGGIRIYKHDAVQSSIGLPGAWFALVPWSGDANFTADLGAKLSDRFVGTGVHAGVEFDQYAGFYRQNGQILYAVSGADGVFEFRGIPYGSFPDGMYQPTPTKYWLVEVAAPEGYRLPTGTPAVIEIFGGYYESDGASWSNKIGVELPDRVGNVKGFNFPLTGGAGTVVFMMAGLVLLGLSYAFYLKSKRKTVLL